ncbi:MAG: ATP-binding protein [Planctomycetaceae bacterium]|nr:ATP-binding protein [Planctomycetaceae bacterium]
MADELPIASGDAEHWRTQYNEIAASAGRLAHEVRNPLSTIGLNLELIEEELRESDAARDRRMHKKVQTLQRECQHLNLIVENFLQFVRTGAADRVSMILNEPVGEFIEIFRPVAAAQHVELVPHLAAQLSPVLLDGRMFRQVLFNLCQNALHAMPDGGQLELLTYERNGEVVLEIIDTGKGMDERTQSRMFDPFFTTRDDGTGLGLATVQRIVMTHEGKIECESALNRGTRFRIRLPVAP